MALCIQLLLGLELPLQCWQISREPLILGSDWNRGLWNWSSSCWNILSGCLDTLISTTIRHYHTGCWSALICPPITRLEQCITAPHDGAIPNLIYCLCINLPSQLNTNWVFVNNANHPCSFRTVSGAGDCCGLFFVNACSLPRTGDAKCLLSGAGVDVGDPADEDGISSTTGGPWLLELLLIPWTTSR